MLNALARRDSGIASKPDSTIVSRVPAPASSSVNVTSVVGSPSSRRRVRWRMDASGMRRPLRLHRLDPDRHRYVVVVLDLDSCPFTSAPGVNGVVSDTPNQVLNCSTSVSARQTRERGASRVTCFSMRSVDVGRCRHGSPHLGSEGVVVGMAEQLDEPLDARIPEAFVARGASRRRAREVAGRCGSSGCARARCASRVLPARASGCASRPRRANPIRRRELADGLLALGESLEHRPAGPGR